MALSSGASEPPALTFLYHSIASLDYKQKDLIPIPWLVALALQADGWYLRSDIIWHKPNPMPESVTDRPTKAHEYLFLLAKSARYYYDADAVAEIAATDPHAPGWSTQRPTDSGPMLRSKADGTSASQWDEPSRTWGANGKRNRRSVWTIPTSKFFGAHFAVFPPELIRPAILAGSAEGDTVLDPFAGAGTTGIVCQKTGRDFIGIELNPEYAEMARKRIVEDMPLLNVSET
jgi:DNA modification methylase